MCGIAGIVGFEPERFIGPMLESVEHRGRDDQGVWVSEPIDGDGRRVCLGHRRLAIIDTSAGGHEPMLSADGRYVLTFNGEIYNYRELREQLRALGHTFRTDSDAEVLLAAITEWRWEALTRLNGMFAFAVWDNRERTLTLVRDHVGIKPLYYAFIPARSDAPAAFLFGSEIKSILATRLIKPELNPEALHQFLTFLWSPDPNTLFANVKTVLPARASLSQRRDQARAVVGRFIRQDRRRQERSTLARARARHAGPRRENGDGRRCSTRIVSFRRHRLFRNRRADGTP